MEKALATTGNQAVTPLAILANAQQQGASVDQLQALMELQMKWEANEARKAFNKAIADFKARNIKIVKNAQVDFQSGKGRVNYRHATLGGVVDQVIDAMSACGLSHTWNVVQTGNQITVCCKLSHVDGHTENTSITAEPDNSGNKNSIQQIGSTVTYLQRYTLLSALGLATYDDDGKSSEQKAVEYINDDQLANLEALVAELKVDTVKLCTYLKVASLELLPAKFYNDAVRAIEKKRSA